MEHKTFVYPLPLTSSELADVVQALPKSSPAKEKAEALYRFAAANEEAAAAEEAYKAYIFAEDVEVWEME